MPDLLIRPTGLDAALISKALTPVATRAPGELVIHPRVVLGADIAARMPEFAAVARRAGVPMLIDPETYYLQDYQHPADRWAALPFGRTGVLTAGELTRTIQRELAETVIDHEIRHGATHVIAPYVHIKKADDGWTERQVGLYRATRAVLDEQGIRLPTIAVVDLGWRLLDRRNWSTVLLPLLAAVEALGFDEIALAGSNVDGGVHPEDRAADLLTTVRRVARTAPVIAWNQGLFGEICVAAGAAGYGTGIGWGERWDTTARMRDRRVAPELGSPRAPRPVYLGKLGRSIPKKTLATLLGHRGIGPDLPCPPGGCCYGGAVGLLGDARWHALYARVASLRRLAETDRPFRWRHILTRADEGLDLARRINVIAAREGLSRVDDAALRAIHACATIMLERRREHAA